MIFLKNKVVLFGLIAMLTGCLTACGESKTEVNTNPAVEENINVSDSDTDNKVDESAEVPESIEEIGTADTAEVSTEAEVSEGADTNQEDAIPTDNTETDDSVSSEPDFTVVDMSMTMYANQSVNVRSGPSTDYDKLGGLSANDEVKITGQADTGWYRIEYKGGEAYVSDSYLVSEKVEVKQPTETPSNGGNNGEQSSGGNWYDSYPKNQWIDMNDYFIYINTTGVYVDHNDSIRDTLFARFPGCTVNYWTVKTYKDGTQIWAYMYTYGNPNDTSSYTMPNLW